MDGFSVASLTSLGSNISHRALSSAEELNELVGRLLDSQPASAPKLSTLSAQLHQLHQQVAQLETALNGSSAISLKLQNHLSQCLSACDGSMAVLNKQVMRLQPDNVTLLNDSFLVVHTHMLDAYCQLFEFCVKLLYISEKDSQDAALDTNEGRACLQQVNDASQKSSQIKEILLQEGQPVVVASSSKGPLPGDDLEPPPYESAGLSVAPESPGESSSSGFAKGMSSLTNSFKAMTSNLWAKPDPLATAFCEAARRGDVRQMKGFLAQGANINGRNAEGRTPLSSAILANEEDAARFLLESSVDMNARDASKIPSLFLACTVGSVDIAQLLLDRGADVNETSWAGQSYFYDVVTSGNIAGTRFLLANGASANTTNMSGKPVLSHAVKNNNIELARLLLQHGADATTRDTNGTTILGTAAANDELEMVRLLLSHGAAANSRDNTGNTLLAAALSKRRMGIAKVLLEHGADASARDIYAHPLLVATIKDNKLELPEKIETARLLLKYGASTNVSDGTWGIHIMCHTMETGSTELVKLMLDYGGRTDKKMNNGETLLLYAMDKGKMDQAKMLIEHGIDTNATDKKGRTALTQALLTGDIELVKLLRRYGADVNKGASISPAELATAMSNPEIFKALGLEMPAPTISGESSRTSNPGALGLARPQSPPPGYDNAVGAP